MSYLFKWQQSLEMTYMSKNPMHFENLAFRPIPIVMIIDFDYIFPEECLFVIKLFEIKRGSFCLDLPCKFHPEPNLCSHLSYFWTYKNWCPLKDSMSCYLAIHIHSEYSISLFSYILLATAFMLFLTSHSTKLHC